MSHILIYTSAPKGLAANKSGYCTVAKDAALPGNLEREMESHSGYRWLGDPGDPLNPVAYIHYKLRVAGKPVHLLSRIGDSGKDYTGRSNKLACHLALSPAELPDGGPGWLLGQRGVLPTEWDGNLDGNLQVNIPSGGSDRPSCSGWKTKTGDAGWGGVLAQAIADNQKQPVWVIYNKQDDLLSLFRESLSLLPESLRWNVTFTTFFTKLPPGLECHWRGAVAGTEAETLARRSGHVIDLTTTLGAVDGKHQGEYIDAARTGRKLQLKKQAAAPRQSVEVPDDYALEASLRKEERKPSPAAPPDRRSSPKGAPPPMPAPTPTAPTGRDRPRRQRGVRRRTPQLQQSPSGRESKGILPIILALIVLILGVAGVIWIVKPWASDTASKPSGNALQSPNIDQGPDSGKPDSGKPDSGKPDSGKPDSGKPDSGKPDSGKPDSGKPDSGKPDSGKPDSGKPDSGKPDSGKPDSGKPDSGKPDSGKPDSGKPDSGKPDSGKPDSGKPDSGKPDSGKPDSGKPDSGKPDSGKPDSGKPEPRRPFGEEVLLALRQSMLKKSGNLDDTEKQLSTYSLGSLDGNKHTNEESYPIDLEIKGAIPEEWQNEIHDFVGINKKINDQLQLDLWPPIQGEHRDFIPLRRPDNEEKQITESDGFIKNLKQLKSTSYFKFSYEPEDDVHGAGTFRIKTKLKSGQAKYISARLLRIKIKDQKNQETSSALYIKLKLPDDNGNWQSIPLQWINRAIVGTQTARNLVFPAPDNFRKPLLLKESPIKIKFDFDEVRETIEANGLSTANSELTLDDPATIKLTRILVGEPPKHNYVCKSPYEQRTEYMAPRYRAEFDVLLTVKREKKQITLSNEADEGFSLQLFREIPGSKGKDDLTRRGPDPLKLQEFYERNHHELKELDTVWKKVKGKPPYLKSFLEVFPADDTRKKPTVRKHSAIENSKAFYDHLEIFGKKHSPWLGVVGLAHDDMPSRSTMRFPKDEQFSESRLQLEFGINKEKTEKYIQASWFGFDGEPILGPLPKKEQVGTKWIYRPAKEQKIRDLWEYQRVAKDLIKNFNAEKSELRFQLYYDQPLPGSMSDKTHAKILLPTMDSTN